MKNSLFTVTFHGKKLLSEVMHTLGVALQMWSGRLRPRAQRGPSSGLDYRKMRAALVPLDNLDWESAMLEEESRESMPTLHGAYLPESAPTIDES